MKNINPFKNEFNQIQLWENISEKFLYLITILFVSVFICQSYFGERYIFQIINKINCILIIAYYSINILIDCLFYASSKKRRSDFIDNSFDSKFAERSTNGYYTNENVEHGIIKFALNGFENAFFTLNITKKMLRSNIVKTILISVIFIAITLFGKDNVLVFFVQLTLPVYLIYQSVNIILFYGRVNNINEKYRKLFNDLKNKESDNLKKIPEILNIILDYETTLMSNAIILNTKIYEKMNDELSEEWIRIKNGYNY